MRFDLTEERWIPCEDLSGVHKELSLKDTLLQAHKLKGLSSQLPLANIAIIRLLIAILLRAILPLDSQRWRELWNEGRFEPEPIIRYFETWKFRFDLFDEERPFYQQEDTRMKGEKSIATFCLDYSSGNNATLFDHHLDEVAPSLTPAEAARILVTLQNFGLAGLSGITDKFTDAPCTRGMVHLIDGEQLFETLMLNTVSNTRLFCPSLQEVGVPFWEQEKPFEKRTSPKGLADYYTWPARRILLHPTLEQGVLVVKTATCGPGLPIPQKHPFRDPMKHYRVDSKKGGEKLLYFAEGKSLWRESNALLSVQDTSQQVFAALQWVRELASHKGGKAIPLRQTYPMIAGGMSTDNAKIHFFQLDRMPVPLSLLQQKELFHTLQQAVACAEDVSKKLYGAASKAASLMLKRDGSSPDKKDVQSLVAHWAPERDYWSRLDRPFLTFLRNLTEAPEESLEEWKLSIKSTAQNAFEAIEKAIFHTRNGAKAAIHGKSQLDKGLNKVLSSQ